MSSTPEWTEYVPVVVSSVASAIIAVYFSNDNSKNFDLEPQMNPVPITLSIFSSVVSGLVLLAFPQESYVHGVTQNGNYIIMNLSVALFGVFIFIPVIYHLELVSLYEYYEKRFNVRVRRLVSILYMISQVVLGALTIYASSVFFSDFSGVNFYLCSSFQIFFCVFCAALGGFKGVVWTDAFQALIMIASVVLLLIFGLNRTGGFGRVMSIARHNERLEVLKLGLDPTERSSIWSLLSDVVNVSYLVGGQSIHQRLMSVRSEKTAKRSLLYGTVTIILFSMSCLLLGLIIYADYYGCDPKKAGIINSYNEITSHWVNTVAGGTPWLRGIFLAGLFCSSISTLSTMLNTLCVTMFIEFLTRRVTATRKTIDLTLTPIFGLVILGAVVLIKDVGSFVEIHYTFRASIGCLIVSVFVMGVFTESITSKGAFWGGICSALLLAAFVFTSKLNHATVYEPSIMKISQCPDNTTLLMDDKHETRPSAPFWLFRISPLNYNFMGFVVSIGLSVVISRFCDDQKSGAKKLDKRLVWRPSEFGAVTTVEEAEGNVCGVPLTEFEN